MIRVPISFSPVGSTWGSYVRCGARGQVLALEREGIVGKRAASPYVAGYSDHWKKCKPKDFHRGWGRPPKVAQG